LMPDISRRGTPLFRPTSPSCVFLPSYLDPRFSPSNTPVSRILYDVSVSSSIDRAFAPHPCPMRCPCHRTNTSIPETVQRQRHRGPPMWDQRSSKSLRPSQFFSSKACTHTCWRVLPPARPVRVSVSPCSAVHQLVLTHVLYSRSRWEVVRVGHGG
jgi:hypothetical protein